MQRGKGKEAERTVLMGRLEARQAGQGRAGQERAGHGRAEQGQCMGQGQDMHKTSDFPEDALVHPSKVQNTS